ncbi:DUF6387 family protein [Nitrosomonas communis]|uniref:Uncharacterized protein n=1 Tax=Nitrosomonas communis TaxID=44574 RepID=A0A1I4UPW4_9PROT|nr:DUF6387 family protein [Nitrosomonas communis]SFM90971.1 hypothetical protein SAMN05421863_106811 [Nitrosomonas communis]
MEIWRKIPSWFKLENYSESANFTSKEWLEQILMRLNHSDILINPDNYLNKLEPDDFRAAVEERLKFFNSMKIDPFPTLISACCELDEIYENLKKPDGEYKPEGEYKHKFASVQELSEYTAYSFLINSSKKAEIENDCSIFSHSTEYEDWINEIKRNLEIRGKYSQPIANFAQYENTKFLEIDLYASDEQILKEFKNWLIDTRKSSNNFMKYQFSTKDFEDWHDSKLLPYWDLTMIATIENATIPNHVIGEALFPNEYGVDLAERIRKSIKKKCQLIFSAAALNALRAQAASEELQGNNF